jgi:hypothetical protein
MSTNPHDKAMAEIQAGKDLKHTSDTKDKSAPVIESKSLSFIILKKLFCILIKNCCAQFAKCFLSQMF